MQREAEATQVQVGSQHDANAGAGPAAAPTPGVMAAAKAALQRILSDPGVAAAQAGAQHALEKIPVTRDLLELMGVWPSHAANPTLPKGQSYGIVHGAVETKELGDATDIAPQDINQGDLGDCYFLSAMAAVARTNPEAIRRLIKDNGDGTYDVTLYVQGSAGWSNKTPQTVRVTSEFPLEKGGIADAHSGSDRKNTGSKDHAELWPMLLEKAFATQRGSYSAIEGGFGVDGFNVLLPSVAAMYPIDPSNPHGTFTKIQAALKAHRALTTGSVHSLTPALQRRADEVNLVLAHEYSIKSVDSHKKTVQVQNPWGIHDLDLTEHDYVQFFNEYCVGAP